MDKSFKVLYDEATSQRYFDHNEEAAVIDFDEDFDVLQDINVLG